MRKKTSKDPSLPKRFRMYETVFIVVGLFFAKLKIITAEKILEPAVFVCNHLGAFGPLAMMLIFPGKVRPWVNYRSMQKGEAAGEIAKGLFKENSVMPAWFRKIIGSLLEKPALWIMNALKAIPVYYDAVNVTETLNESVKTLKSGTNIVVFADKGGDHVDESVKEGIHIGCLYLAPLYEKKNDKPLLFYPVHISKRRREIIIGKPIAYNRKNNYRDEIRRMSTFLSDSIQQVGSRK